MLNFMHLAKVLDVWLYGFGYCPLPTDLEEMKKFREFSFGIHWSGPVLPLHFSLAPFEEPLGYTSLGGTDGVFPNCS